MGVFSGSAGKGGARRRTRLITHPDDEITIRAIEARDEATTPVRSVHHVYFDDEAAAREAGRRVTASGWTVDWLSAQPEPFQGWVLRACRDAVVTREHAARTRAFFVALAHTTGGSYQGWDVRRLGKHALTSP